MSQTMNGVPEVPEDEGWETETISPTVDPDIFMSMVEDAFNKSGTEFPMNMIEEFKGTGEMEWLVKAAERQMLEVCAERLEKFNTSQRAVEWFRDYHGLNDEEAKDAMEKTRQVIEFEQNELPALIPEDYDGPLTPKLEILSDQEHYELRCLLAEVVLDIDENQSKGQIYSDLIAGVFNCYKEVLGHTVKWSKITADVLFNTFFL